MLWHSVTIVLVLNLGIIASNTILNLQRCAIHASVEDQNGKAVYVNLVSIRFMIMLAQNASCVNPAVQGSMVASVPIAYLRKGLLVII